MEHHYPPYRCSRSDLSRNNFYHSSSPYYGVQKRDKGGGHNRQLEYKRSGSSESSWTLWHDQGTPVKSDKLCNALLAFTVSIIVVMIIAIAGLAVYMGALRIDTGQLNLVFDGSIRITYGEMYNQQLSNQTSPLFREKSRKFKSMLETVYSRSALGPALKQLSILGFKNGSLIVFFRIVLDRRKLPKTFSTIEDTAKKILLDEFTNLRPVAMKNLRADTKQIHIKRYIEPPKSLMDEDEQYTTQSLKPEIKNGVLRKSSHSSEIISSAESKSSLERDVSEKPKLHYSSQKKAPPSKTVSGSFTVLKTEDGVSEKPVKSAFLNVENRTTQQPNQLHYSSSLRVTKMPSKAIIEVMPQPISSTTPAALSPTSNLYSAQHSLALNELLRLSKVAESNTPVLPSVIAKKTQTERHVETNTEPFSLYNSISHVEEPWKPILPHYNASSHEFDWKSHMSKTDEYSSQGIGEAEVMIVPPSPEETLLRNNLQPTKQNHLSLSEASTEDYFSLAKRNNPPSERPIENSYSSNKSRPMSGTKAEKVTGNSRTNAPPTRSAIQKGSVFGGFSTQKAEPEPSWHDKAITLEGRNSPHVNEAVSDASSDRIQTVDSLPHAYITEKPEKIPAEARDPQTQYANNESDAAQVKKDSIKTSESLPPVVTLLPVRSNSGVGRPLKPRPWQLKHKNEQAHGPKNSEVAKFGELDKLKGNASSTEILSKTKIYSSNFIKSLMNNTAPESKKTSGEVEPVEEKTEVTPSIETSPEIDKELEVTTVPNMVILNTEVVTSTSVRISFGGNSFNFIPNKNGQEKNLYQLTQDQLQAEESTSSSVSDENSVVTAKTETPIEETTETVLAMESQTNAKLASPNILKTAKRSDFFRTPEKHRSKRSMVISNDDPNENLSGNDDGMPTVPDSTSPKFIEKPLFLPSTNFNRELRKKTHFTENSNGDVSTTSKTDLQNMVNAIDQNSRNFTMTNLKPGSMNQNFDNILSQAISSHKQKPSNDSLLKIISQLASTNSNRNHSSRISNKSIPPSFTINRGGLPLLIKVLNKMPSSFLSTKTHTVSPIEEIPSQNETECKEEKNYRCKNGECIADSLRCNQLVDCSDGSDEKNCSCADYLRGQLLSRKICDGVVDCWDFSDEAKCDWCSAGQYVCANSRLCVNQSQLCDGRKDCPFADDEKQCINIAPSLKQANDFIYHATGHLMVRKQGVWGKLCLQNPAASNSKLHYKIKTLGQTICKSMSFRELDYIEPDSDDYDAENTSPVYYDLISTNWTAISNASFEKTLCSHKQVIKIKCKDLQCGLRPQASGLPGNSLRYPGSTKRHSRIVGGGNAGLGSWPWQAALYKEGEFQCGGALINNKWLLSAGHCFYNALDDYWVARLGALRRGVNFASPYEQVRAISRIILHPEYQAISFMNDISLLELNEPVQISHYIRPICLPAPTSSLEDGTMCTVVGWGQLFEIDRVFPDTLQEVQLPVISAAECRKRTLFLPLYRVTDNMFCAGYERGGRDACLGDSGGPLMSQETDGRWSLYGVTSNGYGCARANRPGVYTKVVNYISWIQSSISKSNNEVSKSETKQCSGHRCRLGECLPQQRVCNGYIECSDGSDEKNCWQD